MFRKLGIKTRETETVIYAKCLIAKNNKNVSHIWCNRCKIHKYHVQTGKSLHCDCRS